MDYARLPYRWSACRGWDHVIRDRRIIEDLAACQVFCGLYMQYGLDRCDCGRGRQRLAGEYSFLLRLQLVLTQRPSARFLD